MEVIQVRAKRSQVHTKWWLPLIVFLPGLLQAQATLQAYCSPSVVGLARPKGIIVRYEVIPQYRIVSKGGNGYGNSEAEISRNGRFDARLRFPIVNKQSLKVAGGLSYFTEEFHFDQPGPDNYPVYKALEDKELRTAGFHLYVMKPTRSNRYFLFRASADMNGDFTEKGVPMNKFLKLSFSPLIGWKKSDDLSYAVGFAYGYIFGRPSFFPLFSYNRNFSRHWGIESILPANLKLRYSVSGKAYWYLTAEVKGASYRLSNKLPGLDNIENPHLHRSEVRLLLSFEREIYKWIWFGVEAGARQNLLFNLTNSPGRNSQVLIRNRLGLAPLVSVTLFAVPFSRITAD